MAASGGSAASAKSVASLIWFCAIRTESVNLRRRGNPLIHHLSGKYRHRVVLPGRVSARPGHDNGGRRRRWCAA